MFFGSGHDHFCKRVVPHQALVALTSQAGCSVQRLATRRRRCLAAEVPIV